MNVSDFAEEFVRRAREGGNPRVSVSKNHAESFLFILAREGFVFARQALENISDPELRRIIETLFFSTVAGAGAGAAIGAMVGGIPGAKVGAGVGAAVGFVSGCIALTLVAYERDEKLVIEVG